MPYKRKYRKYLKKRMSRGRSSRKYRQRRFQARVRQAVMKTAETKYKMGAGEATSLYHDRGDVSAGALTTNQGALVFNPWYTITTGDTVSNRDGDEIYPRGFSMRLAIWNETTRPAIFVRIIVAVIPKIVGTNITNGSNFDLLDQAGSNDTVTGMIKREGVKVLYDKTFKNDAPSNTVPTAAGYGQCRMFKKFFIKSKGGKLKWGQDGLLQNKPVGVWVIPYDTYFTLRTDAICQCSYTYKMYFKDV